MALNQVYSSVGKGKTFMKKYKIITDSGCDISKENEEQHKIDIMSFEITLGDEVFWERKDITPQEFYEKIDKSEYLPKTSQITILRFEEKFRECFEQGYEELIVVLINSTGSQTFANAEQAKLNVEGEIDGLKGKMNIHVIDSHCYSMGYGYPIVEAAKKLEAGQSIDKAVSYLEDMFNCCEIYIVGFGLRHLKKSGRVNAAAAFLGELMGLKPLISLIDGESAVLKKSRGDKNAVSDAVEYIATRAIPETQWQILRTTVTEQEEDFIKQFTKKMGREPAMVEYSGGVVSSNAGPQMFGVIIKGQPRR